jgi:hypothetical protein
MNLAPVELQTVHILCAGDITGTNFLHLFFEG